MITLFEPFQTKIKLHIRQDFLQELWDKYVPVSAESYDNISLIYLKGATGEAEKGTKQVQVLVDLVLKNLFMQINISQNPMLVTQKGVSKSLQYTLKHYLAQLRRTDLQVFQSLKRYMISLKQAETENTRFESWKKDSRVLGQMEKEYQILRHVSQSLRALSTERSFEIEKMLGTELLRSMKKTEYRIFAKTMAWQERKQVEEYIRNCSQAEFRQMVERLAEETTFSFLKISEHDVSKERLIEEIENHFGQDDFWKFYHKVVFPEKRMSIGEEKILEDSVQFRKSMLIWDKTRKRMIHRLDQLSSEEIHDFWKQICEQAAVMFEQQEEALLESLTEQKKETQELLDIYRSFCVKLAEVQKKYVLEMRKSLQTIVEETQEVLPDVFIHIMNQQPILKYSTTMTDMETADTVINEQYELSEIQDFQNAVIQIRQAVEHRLEEQKNRIVEREIEVLNRYQDILHINDIIRDWDSQQQAVREQIEEVFRSYHESQLTSEAVRKLQSWCEALQEKVAIEDQREFQKVVGQINEYGKQHSFHIEYRESFLTNETVQELLRYTRQMDQEKYPLLIRALSDMIRARQLVQEQQIVQMQQRTVQQGGHGQTEKEAVEKEFYMHQDTKLSKEAVRKLYDWSKALLTPDTKVTIEERTEFQKIVEQINEYGRQHSFHLEYRESILAKETVQELLRHIRQMEREQYPMLVEALSDMIQAQQTVRRESSVKIQSRYPEEERESTTASALPPEELRYLDVEKVFRSYYGKQMTVEAIRELYDWSESLQTGEEAGHQEKNELISERNQESLDHMSTDMRTEVISGDMQTEVIRQHIQQAKDRVELQQLVEQVNHYTDGTVRLEYREEQIQNPSIQKLIRHIRQLDEEEHRLFIRQLSKMIEVRQGIQEWEDAASQKPEYSEENAVRGLQNIYTGRKKESENRTIEQRYQKTKLEGYEKKTTGQPLRLNYRISQRVYEVYPELSRCIQEYEVRRREIYETEIRQLTVSESMNHVLSRALRRNAAVVYDTGSVVYDTRLAVYNTELDSKLDIKQELRLLPEPYGYEDQHDLKHAVSKSQTQRGRSEQDSRMQEEKIQMKSAQSQMDVRLKQVEQQLKQVKIQDSGKEDVRETAERIKKLLHEELHLEKLRRGMT